MTLPSNVNYGQVIGRFLLAVGDTGDPDNYPDGVAAQGTVTFTPAPEWLLNATADPDAVTILPKPITCNLDATGVMIDPDGNAGCYLIATDDPDLNPTDWTYTVTLAFDGVRQREFSIKVPTDAVVDLTTASPVAGSIGDAQVAGESATITVGSTTTLAPGSDATVTNSGDENDAILDFGIPTGDQGPQGVKGDPGNTWHSGAGAPSDTLGLDDDHYLDDDSGDVYKKTGGTWGTPIDNLHGPGATIAIGTTTTLPEGDATVENVGTATDAILDFGIPRGPEGIVGQPGPVGPVGNTIAHTVGGGETFTMNPSGATEYALTLVGNMTLAVQGLTNGAAVTAILVQDGVGGRTVTVPSSWIGQSELSFTATANEYDIVVVWKTPLGIHVKRVHTGALPSSFWSPSQLADQRFWFNANSISAEDLEDLPGTWANEWDSANNMEALSGKPTVRLAHGEKYLQLVASEADYLQLQNGTGGLTEPYCIALLVRQNATGDSTTRRVVGGSTTLDPGDLNVSGAPLTYKIGGSDGTAALAASGSWETVVLAGNDSTSYLRLDGTQSDYTVSGDFSQLRICRNDASPFVYNDMDIAEMIVFDHIPDSIELADLEDYLNAKRDTLNGVV